jgi:hypothetical protein
MIGLIFLAVIGCWIWLALRLARLLSRKIASPTGRIVIGATVFTALLALPVSDEIAGGFQHRSLCAKNILPTVNAEKTRGRRVRVETDPANKEVGGTWVRILYSHSSYRDADIDEELFSSDRYVASGGWLIRALSTDNHMTPLTFESTCDTTPSTDLGLEFVR